MPRNTSRSVITVVAAAGLFSSVQILSPTATADPATTTSPGVPCMDIVQQIAASPPDIQQALQNAASTLTDSAPQPATPVPAASVDSAGSGVSPPGGPVPAVGAVGATPGVRPPVAPVAAVPAAPVSEAAGVVPPLAAPVPPIPAAELAQLVPTPQLILPTVPGLPVPLPGELSLPHDLVCEGTAWSASISSPGSQAPPAPATSADAAPTANRRDHW
jgi:hypothetical protein